MYNKEINNIRKNGNYLYEEFIPTDGFDIKIYTVGPEYNFQFKKILHKKRYLKIL